MSNNKQLENASKIPAFEEMAKVSALCNDSSIEYQKEHDAFERVGEATEVALKVAFNFFFFFFCRVGLTNIGM